MGIKHTSMYLFRIVRTICVKVYISDIFCINISKFKNPHNPGSINIINNWFQLIRHVMCHDESYASKLF